MSVKTKIAMSSISGDYKHTPVLLQETIDGLKIKPEGIYIDGTLGGGGHASQICERLSDKGTLIGIDRDKDALETAEKNLSKYNCKKIIIHGNYARIKSLIERFNINEVDGGILDLGVSSYQLDEETRGFSYMKDAPLDMRMNTESEPTAEEIINEYSEKELARIIKEYGEERWAKRIAEFIVKGREDERITRTGELTEIIKAAIPASARRTGPHPAKRTFQAIRIEVNNELKPLEDSINDFIDILKPKGRLAVITFHSLEDRIVKEVYRKREDPCTCPKDLPQCVCGLVGDVKRITKKPIIASEEELSQNPRSRSAKLRIVEKL